MSQKIKEFIKKYMIGLTLSFLICTVSVSAITYFDSKNVTYNNETTGMASTNVQDAVNELYSVCFPPSLGDSILEDVPIVSSGDGLYKDAYEEGRYFYKGKNVNNYITFNNEMWRIVSVEPDKTIKIMREANLEDRVWDSSGSNNWARPASLNTYLNGSYLKEKLNSTAQSQIVAKDWNVGSTADDNNDLASQIKDEKATIWNGKVALITASEYIRSHSDQNNCGTSYNIKDNSNICKNNSWMYINDDWWSLTIPNYTSKYIFFVYRDGFLMDSSYFIDDIKLAVRPSTYLSSEVKITGGNGTQENPYILG